MQKKAKKLSFAGDGAWAACFACAFTCICYWFYGQIPAAMLFPSPLGRAEYMWFPGALVIVAVFCGTLLAEWMRQKLAQEQIKMPLWRLLNLNFGFALLISFGAFSARFDLNGDIPTIVLIVGGLCLLFYGSHLDDFVMRKRQEHVRRGTNTDSLLS